MNAQLFNSYLKTILFTKNVPEAKIKNTWLMKLTHFIFQKGRLKDHCQFCRIGKDFDHNGDRMSKNDEKLPYLHLVTKKYFLLAMQNMGLCLYMRVIVKIGVAFSPAEFDDSIFWEFQFLLLSQKPMLSTTKYE